MTTRQQIDISATVNDKGDNPAGEVTTRQALEAAGLVVLETLGGGLAYVLDTPALVRQLERAGEPVWIEQGDWLIGLQIEEG